MGTVCASLRARGRPSTSILFSGVFRVFECCSTARCWCSAHLSSCLSFRDASEIAHGLYWRSLWPPFVAHSPTPWTHTQPMYSSFFLLCRQCSNGLWLFYGSVYFPNLRKRCPPSLSCGVCTQGQCSVCTAHHRNHFLCGARVKRTSAGAFLCPAPGAYHVGDDYCLVPMHRMITPTDKKNPVGIVVYVPLLYGLLFELEARRWEKPRLGWFLVMKGGTWVRRRHAPSPRWLAFFLRVKPSECLGVSGRRAPLPDVPHLICVCACVCGCFCEQIMISFLFFSLFSFLSLSYSLHLSTKVVPCPDPKLGCGDTLSSPPLEFRRSLWKSGSFGFSSGSSRSMV
eukprot:RCo029458